MIYLNFTNLDEETQQHLMTVSKKDIEQKFGLDLQRYAKRNNVDYQSLLETPQLPLLSALSKCLG